MIFWGFEYWDGKNTTTGNPNKKTGFMSRAGVPVKFYSKKDRDNWVNSGCKSYGGRIAVNKKSLRRLMLGLSKIEFEELVKSL